MRFRGSKNSIPVLCIVFVEESESAQNMFCCALLSEWSAVRENTTQHKSIRDSICIGIGDGLTVASQSSPPSSKQAFNLFPNFLSMIAKGFIQFPELIRFRYDSKSASISLLTQIRLHPYNSSLQRTNISRESPKLI